LHKQSKHLSCTENISKPQALESIGPTLVPPTCRGIPIDLIPLKTCNNKSYGIAKNDKLGAISSNGYFVCPKCYIFETMHIKLFREHLYKEINYKT